MYSNKLTYLTIFIAILFGIFAVPQMFPEVLRWSIPIRVLLCCSILLLLISIILLILTYSKWIKSVKNISNRLAYFMFLIIFHPVAWLCYFLVILTIIIFISNFNYSIITLSAIAFALFLVSLKRSPLQEYSNSNNKEIIFDDNFSSNKGWSLNYWGTTNPNKTNRIENSTMIFEAKEDELLNEEKEFGACIDLRNGIQDGNRYEIVCNVKSESNATMGFQLWVHDTIGRNPAVSVKSPLSFTTPNEDYQLIKLKYVANSNNAIRIHMHNKGGEGRIIVNRITVYKCN